MNEDDFKQARLNHAAGVLHTAVVRFCESHPFDRSTIETVREMVELHTHEARAQGVDFPPMSVVGFARIRAIEIVRKDWEPADVQNWILALAQRHPTITADDIGEAIAVTFPDYRRSLLQ